MNSNEQANCPLISFFEIPAIDFNRAVTFYETLFSFRIDRCDCGEEKMGFFPDNGSGLRGAISLSNGFNPSSDGVLVHFATDRIDWIVQHVEAGGGKIILPKTAIEAEGQGCFALILDSEGNRIGIHQPE